MTFKSTAQWNGTRPRSFAKACDDVNGGKGNTCCTKTRAAATATPSATTLAVTTAPPDLTGSVSTKGYEKVPGTRDKQCANSDMIGGNPSITLDKCAAMVNAEARCGDHFAYWKGGECHCVRAGQKCEPYQDNEAHDVYRLTTPKATASPVTTGSAKGYEKIPGTRNKQCANSGMIGDNPRITLDNCAAMVNADANCGDYFAYYKGGECHCVRAGQKCEPYQDNAEHDVYRLTSKPLYSSIAGTDDKRCHDSITLGRRGDPTITLDICAGMVKSDVQCGDYFAWYVLCKHAFTVVASAPPASPRHATPASQASPCAC